MLGSVVTISENTTFTSFDTYSPNAYDMTITPPSYVSALPTTSITLTNTAFESVTSQLSGGAYVDNPDGTVSIYGPGGNLQTGENVNCSFSGPLCGTPDMWNPHPFSLVSMDVSFVGSPVSAPPLPQSGWLMRSALGIVFLFLRQPQQPRNKTIV